MMQIGVRKAHHRERTARSRTDCMCPFRLLCHCSGVVGSNLKSGTNGSGRASDLRHGQ